MFIIATCPTLTLMTVVVTDVLLWANAESGNDGSSVNNDTGRAKNEEETEEVVDIAACPDPTRVSYGQVMKRAIVGLFCYKNDQSMFFVHRNLARRKEE